MTNLPTHLTDKIETGAQEWATSGSLKEWIDTGMNDTRYSSTLKTFLAGASFLYSLLKEEKGEVGRLVKATERLPESNDDKNLFLRWVWGGNLIMGVGRYFGRFVDGHKGSLDIREDQIEWLDTETPVVAGCGELVEALELAEVELKAMYKRLGFKGSNVLDKVTEALKNV